MASRNETVQLVTSFSIPREEFLGKVVANQNLKRRDYVVLVFLLTQLEGWNSLKRMIGSSTTLDPKNYRKLDIKNTAVVLGMEKSDIRQSLKVLKDEGIIEEGSSVTVKKGYRFTF